jgi:sigma-B regulation protein RsbQ
VVTPTLVLQCSDDVIAPDAVGTFVANQIGRSTFVRLRATGHCPNLSAPGETVTAIRSYLDGAVRERAVR